MVIFEIHLNFNNVLVIYQVNCSLIIILLIKLSNGILVAYTLERNVWIINLALRPAVIEIKLIDLMGNVDLWVAFKPIFINFIRNTILMPINVSHLFIC